MDGKNEGEESLNGRLGNDGGGRGCTTVNEVQIARKRGAIMPGAPLKSETVAHSELYCGSFITLFG